MAKHEASLAAIEEEIKTAKASFEEDLLKIESKMSQNPDSLMRDEDLIHEDDEENEETENKPRSVLKIFFSLAMFGLYLSQYGGDYRVL